MDQPGWPEGRPSQAIKASYAEAEPHPYWFDTVAPEGVEGDRTSAAGAGDVALPAQADLVVIGAGLTGLWAALLALQRQPGRQVVLVEAERIAYGASGRNGGFISSSLTHGVANGMAREPREMAALEHLGRVNLSQAEATLNELEIDCDLHLAGSLSVALTETEVAELPGEAEQLRELAHQAEVLDREAIQAQINSPTYRGALLQRSGEGLLNPVKLSYGLARAIRELGGGIHEGVSVTRLEQDPGGGVILHCRERDGRPAKLRTLRAILATAAFPGLLPEIRRRIVPVYDYVLVSEPLTPAQREAIGWEMPVGVSDRGNRFHYYRLTEDNRLLWGGFDAVYHFGNRLEPRLDQRETTFGRLAQNAFHTFPQLEGLRFSHRWGGAIDTCSRFAAFYGTAMAGQVAYAVGHTGLGVGASRFAAGVALDRVEGRNGPATELNWLQHKPLSFPPEPLRWGVIQLTQNQLAAADRRGGRRGPWLSLLDRLGLGFDS